MWENYQGVFFARQKLAQCSSPNQLLICLNTVNCSPARKKSALEKRSDGSLGDLEKSWGDFLARLD